MPKIIYYFCDYCQVVLTHDSMSVRKSHASGRQHVKLVCDYYENAARENNIPIENQGQYQYQSITPDIMEIYNSGIPGVHVTYKKQQQQQLSHESTNPYDIAEARKLPPPPTMAGMPPPPIPQYNRTV